MSQFFEFAVNHWDLFLALAIIIAMIVWTQFAGRLLGYKDCSPAEAIRLMNHEDALLLDVREEKEYKEGYINGAKWIPLGKLQQQMGELEAHAGKPIVAYCRSGHRSAKACALLVRGGHKGPWNLKGGIMAWQSAGMPVEKESGKKSKSKKG